MENKAITESNTLPQLEQAESAEWVKFKVDELKIRIDTYRFYLNLALQINGFFYVTTGVVLGFYLNRPDGRVVFFLLLPILVGSVLGGIFLYGAHLQRRASNKIKKIIRNLNKRHGLNIKGIDDINLLRLLLSIFGSIFFLISMILTAMPIIRALLATSTIPEHLILFGVAALCALIGGGCATLIVNRIFRWQKRKRKAEHAAA